MSDLLGKFKSEDCCDEGADCHHPNPGPVHEHSKDLDKSVTEKAQASSRV